VAGTTKRQRVLAALAGEPVDRVPYGGWAHNYARENSAEDLAEETARLLREFDFDFLKPQTRAQAFEECFGAVWHASGERATPPTQLRYPVTAPAEYRRIEPADWTAGALGEQLDALRAIRAAVGDVPIIWTIFNPLMIARRLAAGGLPMLQEAMREQPAALRSALDAITATMTGYARAAVAAGADGLFYATNVGSRGTLTEEEYAIWGPADDRKILAAVADAPFTMLHTCGEAVYFNIFAEYPVAVFNYAIGPANPSLAEIERRTGRAVAGGVSTKPADALLGPEDVKREVREAIATMHGRHLLVAPGCSNSPGAADVVFGAVRDAIRGC
jgi:uroporphyrinogen decarboxylase